MLPLKELSNCIKSLSACAINKAQSGHPGMPLGMSDFITILLQKHLVFNPNDSKWLGRDRLILSAGHGSMLLYSIFYLTGYKNFNLEDIKNFRTKNAITAGHPEYHLYDAIETTTGPLGQGFANAVGMAIGAKKYYSNKEIKKHISREHKIYAIVGDGCLMEGISYEAASIAGHLSLDNLIVIFDSNNISIDGNTNLTISENHIAKFQAFGFETIEIDGHNFDEIDSALTKAQNAQKPVLIKCNTIIGKGVKSHAGTNKVHGAPLEKTELDYLLNNINFEFNQDDIDEKYNFNIPKNLLDQWRNTWIRNKKLYDNWQLLYSKIDLKEQKYWRDHNHIEQKEWNNLVNSLNSKLTGKENLATRYMSGMVIDELLKYNNKIIYGSADLSDSNNLKKNNMEIITKNDFSGNYIHYGIREHAMAAIANGLALEGFTPIIGSFFVFSDYMRPAMRLAALMKLRILYIMTHDSIGVGEDGPTHQPIEHLASFRAMPNIMLFRPSNMIELSDAYSYLLTDKNHNNTPVILALSRQKFDVTTYLSSDTKSKYMDDLAIHIIDHENVNDDWDCVIFASGSEIAIASDVRKILISEHNIKTRIISVNCFDLLHKQDNETIKSLIGNAKLKIVIEAATEFGWHKIVGQDALFFCINDFGISAKASDIYEHFGLYSKNIVRKIISNLNNS